MYVPTTPVHPKTLPTCLFFHVCTARSKPNMQSSSLLAWIFSTWLIRSSLVWKMRREENRRKLGRLRLIVGSRERDNIDSGRTAFLYRSKMKRHVVRAECKISSCSFTRYCCPDSRIGSSEEESSTDLQITSLKRDHAWTVPDSATASAQATAGSCEHEPPRLLTAVAWGCCPRDEDQGNQWAPN